MERVCDSAHVEVGQAEQGRSGQQTNEDQRINVQALVCGKQLKIKIFHICLLVSKHLQFHSECWKLHSD